MAYTKQNFEDNNILYASQLNHIEDGIANINTVTNFTSTANADGDTVLTLTFADGSSKSVIIPNPVNFKVVGGTTTPGSPTENTIWVNTSTAIPSWAFSAEEPGSPAAGMVWISTGTSSPVEFNALKKNEIQVYPGTVKQYVSGAWVARDAAIYQGGGWKPIIAYLYNNGDECEDMTGGWDNDGWGGNGSTQMTIGTKNTDHMLIGTATALSASKWFNLATKNKIHITESHKTIYAEVTPMAIYQEASITVAVCSSKMVGSENAAAAAKYEGTKNVKDIIAIDVSDLVGEYYVACYNYVYQGVTRCAQIHRIWMQ